MSEIRYQVINSLGKSRTGEVCVAEDSRLQRQVALRRFSDEEGVIDFTGNEEDFTKAAQILSSVQHPNLLKIFDVGIDDEGAYVASQLLEGESLHEEIKRGPIHPFIVGELARQMLDAYSLVHDQDCYHGVLTPDSVLMTPQARGGYRYIILDMGLSKLISLIGDKDLVHTMLADSAILAPELFDGGKPDERSDLYMLGQLCYLCIAGQHPFNDLSSEEAKELHFKGVPPVTDYIEDVPEDLVEWLNKLTAVNPKDRFESAVDALKAVPQLTPPPIVQQEPSAHTDTGNVIQANPIKKTTSVPARPATAPVPVTPATAPVPITAPGAKAGVYPRQVTAAQPLPENQPSAEDVSQPTPKKLPLAAIVGIGVFVIGGIVAAIMLLGGDELQDDTSDAGLITYYDGLSGQNEGWKFRIPGKQSLDKDGKGWLIKDDDRRVQPGVRFSIDSHVEKMYTQGWRISYRAITLTGTHRIGFLIDDIINPGWSGGGNVSCCVVFKANSDKIYIYSPTNNSQMLRMVNILSR